MLDYCSAVRGILNDDQGGPLHPPGLRMAEALAQVRESLERVLAMNKLRPAHQQLARLAGCIDQGLAVVKSQQEQVREQVQVIAAVAAVVRSDVVADEDEFGRHCKDESRHANALVLR